MCQHFFHRICDDVGSWKGIMKTQIDMMVESEDFLIFAASWELCYGWIFPSSEENFRLLSSLFPNFRICHQDTIVERVSLPLWSLFLNLGKFIFRDLKSLVRKISFPINMGPNSASLAMMVPICTCIHTCTVIYPNYSDSTPQLGQCNDSAFKVTVIKANDKCRLDSVSSNLWQKTRGNTDDSNFIFRSLLSLQ